MAVQELKTQLVFEASNAIKSMSVLYETLNKVAHVDFKQLSNGFREMAKVIEFAQTQAGDSIRRAVIEGSQKAVDAQKKAIEQLKRNAEQQMKDLAERNASFCASSPRAASKYRAGITENRRRSKRGNG